MDRPCRGIFICYNLCYIPEHTVPRAARFKIRKMVGTVMGQRYPPRRMELEALVETLVGEHVAMKEGLRRAREAARRRDFDGVSRALRAVDPLFRQHIADEESQILGLLIAKLGVKGAEAEILVFRQHRPIHGLMEKVKELASKSASELEGSQGELDKLFEAHTPAEEATVFPRVLSVRDRPSLVPGR